MPSYSGGGGDGGRSTTIVSGSPFATKSDLEGWSELNPSELFNTSFQVSLAVVNADPAPANNATYQWAGTNQVYATDQWAGYSGLDASDIKTLYESNPNTNAFTDIDNQSVSSVIGLADGDFPSAFGNGLIPSLINQPSINGIVVDGTIQATKDTLFVGQSLSLSEDGLDIRADNIVENISAIPARTTLNPDGSTGATIAVNRANRQTLTIQPNDSQVFPGTWIAWVPITQTRITKQIIVRFASAATGIRVTLRDSLNQSTTNGAILFQSHTDAQWNSGQGYSVPGTGDFTIEIQNSAKFVQGRFVYVVAEQNLTGTGSIQIKGVTTTIAGVTQFYAYLAQTFLIETNDQLAKLAETLGSVSAGENVFVDNTNPREPVISSFIGRLFVFTDSNGSLTESQVKASLPNAGSITDWNASISNTSADDFPTVTGSRFIYVAIPTAESLSSIGVSLNGGVAWTDFAPIRRFNVDLQGINYVIYGVAIPFNYTNPTFRFRFTTVQVAGIFVNLLDALQNADSVRYDSATDGWYNSRTAGSCVARRNSANQSIPSATDTRVGFDNTDISLELNPSSVGLTYDSVTNIGRFTNTSGRKILLSTTIQIPWASNNSGIRSAWIRYNGVVGSRIGYSTTPASTAGNITVVNSATVLSLDNNQFFEVFVNHTAPGALNIGNVGGGINAGFGTLIQIARLNP